MLIGTRVCVALFEATAYDLISEDGTRPRKIEGPTLDGTGQDVAIEDLQLDSSGVDENTSDPPSHP